MSFNDILGGTSVADFNAASLSAKDLAAVFGITMILSLYIFFIYRIVSRKTFYNKSFNISLAALALTAAP